METKNIIDLLTRSDIFKGLPKNFIPSVATQFKPVEFKAQEVVIEQNQVNENFYIITKGQFESYRKDEAGIHTHISYLLPGDYFGILYLLHNQSSPTEIIALEESECLYIPKENFLRFIEIDPEISQQIFKPILLSSYKTSVAEEAAVNKEKVIKFFQENKRLSQFTTLIGKTKEIKGINKSIEKMAKNDDPFLIEGEYGTGKELISKIIHNKSKRAKKPFISVDCEKLIPETIDNQLFGNHSFYPNATRQQSTGFSYFELAEGGTVLLKNIELLPLKIQLKIYRLLSTKNNKNQKNNLFLPDVRIIATTRTDLESKLEEIRFDKKLFQLLSSNKIIIPPLRKRKRDIPGLVEHLIKKYSQYYGKKVNRISPTAMKNLLAHDYKLANLQELEEIIARAVSLTMSDTVRSEHLFLGLPAEKPLVLFNLLKLGFFASWVKKRIYPDEIRKIAALAFLLIIGLSLFSHRLSYPYNNLGKLLTWSLWWPLMFISFFFVGRLWCSICPYATYSHLVKRIINFEYSFPFKKYDYLFMSIGFLFVIWIEEVSFMRESSFKVGILQLSILTLAVIMGIVYKRDSWCRYICPLGALISTCAMASIVEVRSNTDLCINKCATHDCYKGTKDNPGCPMFQLLMYVDNNQTCKMCLNCVRSCPNNNIALNIRPPATEIYYSNQLNKGLFLFVIAFMGVLIPILLMHKKIISYDIFKFTFIYLLTPALILLFLCLITVTGFKSKEKSKWEILWHSTYAYIPLALTAHIAFQLQFLPIVNNLFFNVLLSPSISANIVIYSKTLFNLFKIIYLILEAIIFLKIILYIFMKFIKIDIKESKSALIKPIITSIIISIALYFIPTINNYIFNLLTPASESTSLSYNIPVFHVFQFIILMFGLVLSFYSIFRILKKKVSNIKDNKIFLAYHFLFMIFYSLIVLSLLSI